LATVDVDCAYDFQVSTNGSSKNDAPSVLNCQRVSSTSFNRVGARFDLPSVLTAPGAGLRTVVSAVSLRVNVTTENIETSDATAIKGYGSTGDRDPQPDNAATANTECNAGGTLVSVTTPFQSVGVKTVDLSFFGAPQLQAILDASGTFWALAANPNYDLDNEVAQFEGLANAGSSPWRITVTYNYEAEEGSAVQRRRIEGE
jgi:hypothetical protein